MPNQTAIQQNGTIKAYNPREHLVQIKTKEGLKDYYPAGWRLYELNLRYEEANFSTEIVFMDIERNFVIVKCQLYLGPDYEMSPRKTQALKQGRLSELDKVETAAKARCARDLGVSTEYTLLDDELVDTLGALPAQQSPTRPQSNEHAANSVEAVQGLFASTYKVAPEQLVEHWSLFVVSVLGRTIADSELTEAQVARLHGTIIAAQREQAQQVKQQSNSHMPAMTAGTVQAWFAKVYKVAPVDLDTRWHAFKKYVLKSEGADNDLTEDQLNKLNGYISGEYEKQMSSKAGRGKPAA